MRVKYLPPAVRLRTKRCQKEQLCDRLSFLALKTFSGIQLMVSTPLGLQSTVTKEKPEPLGDYIRKVFLGKMSQNP